MAIRFTVGGTEYTVDTAAEVADIQKTLGKNGSTPKLVQLGKPASQSKIIQTLSETYSEMDRDALAKALGVKQTQLTPMFAHARRWVHEVAPKGVKFEDAVEKTHHSDGSSTWKLTKKGRDLVESLESNEE